MISRIETNVLRGMLFVGVLSTGGMALGEDLTIHVAGRDSGGYEAAQKMSNPERSIFRALNAAAEHLNKGGATTVTIKVAAGDYDGQAGTGMLQMPKVTNPAGRLLILAGYGDDMVARDPMVGAKTRIISDKGRNGGMLAFTQGSALSELVVSGFWFDSAPCNDYDNESNSFLRASSRTVPILALKGIKLQRLIVSDNMFLNGGHMAFDPMMQAQGDKAECWIMNNFFVNNIRTMKAMWGVKAVAKCVIKSNTFLGNWPYNPDKASSDVGGLTLNSSDSAKEMIIDGNVFAFNVGGAMQHDWQENRMPKMTITNNLFYRNGIMFDEDKDDSAVFVGKFGSNPFYKQLTLEDIEDDFGYTMKGNVVGNPGLDFEYSLFMEEDGDDVILEGFAPRQTLEAAPFVKTEQFKKLGAQRKPAYPVGG